MIRRAVSLAVFVLAASATVSLAAGATGRGLGDRLKPDLINLRPRHMRLFGSVGGARRLSFTTYTVNIGAGPLELRSRRLDCNGNGDTSDDRTAVQRTYLDSVGDGVFNPGVDTASSAHVAGCFAFDAQHGHWHFSDFESFQLLDPHSGAVVAAHHKVGFCLVDDFPSAPNLPGAPRAPVYVLCRRNTTQGISIGWTDVYSYSLPSQWIDVSGVPSGRYCLSVTVDPANRIVEADDSNNTTARMIRLTRRAATPASGRC